MTGSSLTKRKIMDLCDILATVVFLNEALHMAAMGDGITSNARDALQAVSSEIDNKLLIVKVCMEEMLEDNEL